ncbi:MAG: hypothetical protein L6N96_01885 [Candidatus Methylarchaceae archaeon HK02M2]|nr:hypothetical protein [Candidatus Methylarchaceae archaeon HK02M2]
MSSSNKSKNISFGFTIGIILSPLIGLLLAIVYPDRGADYLLTICLPLGIAVGWTIGWLLGERVSQLSERSIVALAMFGVIIWVLVILAIEIFGLY